MKPKASGLSTSLRFRESSTLPVVIVGLKFTPVYSAEKTSMNVPIISESAFVK